MKLSGDAVPALENFYARLSQVPRSRWAELLVAMGHNFEAYDGLFALMVAQVQLSYESSDYQRRYRAVQASLVPLCSEYGIELAQPMARTHRELFADFFRAATGNEFPSRYPADNPWLAVSRRWTARMEQSIGSRSEPNERARFSLGYYWAVEHLSIPEMSLMRDAWARLGIKADYLDVHCAVEGEHDSFAARALAEFCGSDDAVAAEAARTHEAELAGFYRELAQLL